MNNIYMIGLALIILNLLGVYFLGIQIAFDGINSDQPLFDTDLPLNLLPIAAFLIGIIAGIGLVIGKYWSYGMIIAYTAFLAIASPIWAQQVDIGIFIYSTRPPHFLSVLWMCVGSVVLVIITVLLLNIPSVKSAFSQYYLDNNKSEYDE